MLVCPYCVLQRCCAVLLTLATLVACFADASLTMGRFDLLVGYRRGKADKNDRKKQKKKTIEPVMSTPTSFDVMDVDEQAGSSGRDEVPEVCEEEIEYNSEGEQE